MQRQAKHAEQRHFSDAARANGGNEDLKEMRHHVELDVLLFTNLGHGNDAVALQALRFHQDGGVDGVVAQNVPQLVQRSQAVFFQFGDMIGLDRFDPADEFHVRMRAQRPLQYPQRLRTAADDN